MPLSHQLALLERALIRLATALADHDDEIALIAATTVRTVVMTTEIDIDTAADPAASARFEALHARARALLARAPQRVHGTRAALRLLEHGKRGD